MKTFFCTSLCSLLCFYSISLCAQDWQLINPDYHYHFVILDSLGQKTDSLDAYTVRVDSAHGDTVFLNRWFPEIEGFFNWEAYLIHNPHFLQKKMIRASNGDVQFRQPGDLRIPYTYGQEESWLFDAKMGIEAQLDSIVEVEIYGSLDSVKFIGLSSGDQIRLSKSFGVLQFPKTYGEDLYYQQIGISGPDLGFTFPRVEDFFGFAPGDKFEYLNSVRIGNYGNGANDTEETEKVRVQIEILDTLTMDGELQYRVQKKSCTLKKETLIYDETAVLSSSEFFRDEINTESFDITAFPYWSKEGDSSNIWDVYPHEAVIGAHSRLSFTPISTITYSRQESCLPGLKRRINYWNCLRWQADSVMACEGGNPEWDGSISWVEGVGLFSEHGNGYFSYETRSTSRSLEASYVDGKSCGTFTDMSEAYCEALGPGDPDPAPIVRVKELTFAYQNPVVEDIVIAFPEEHNVASVALVDLSGRRVFQEEIQEQWELKIPAFRFSPGLYILALRDVRNEMVELKKVIINP